MRRLVALVALAGLMAACGSPLPANLTSSELPDLASLDTEWGCGYGFWLGDKDETVALRFHFEGERPDRAVELPHPDWEVMLLLGTDLYANWCDDVFGDGSALPVTHWELPVVGGHLALSGDLPSEPFESTVMTLTARDLIVELPGGERVPLGSVIVTNPSWGFLAG